MNIKIDIYLNQLALGIISDQEGTNWFESLENKDQLVVLQKIVFFTLQSDAIAQDVEMAIKNSGLKSSYTPCQLLYKAFEEEPRGNKFLRLQLAKVLNLPIYERRKSFLLLTALFKIADSNKRKQGIFPDKYWWHRDLSDEEVVNQIKLENF